MKKLTESDRQAALQYMSAEPHYTHMMNFDISTYGFLDPNQEVWFQVADGAPALILLRYYDTILVYSRDDGFDPDPVTELISGLNAAVVLGKKSTVDALNSKGARMFVRYDYFATLETTPPDTVGYDIFRAEERHIDGIMELHCNTDEFDTKMRRDSARKILEQAISNSTGRYYCIANGDEILSVVGSAAETADSAMLMGFATAKSARRRGYSTALTRKLCHDLMSEGRKSLHLFYDNPEAGRIYANLGFRQSGMWAAAGMAHWMNRP